MQINETNKTFFTTSAISLCLMLLIALFILLTLLTKNPFHTRSQSWAVALLTGASFFTTISFILLAVYNRRKSRIVALASIPVAFLNPLIIPLFAATGGGLLVLIFLLLAPVIFLSIMFFSNNYSLIFND